MLRDSYFGNGFGPIFLNRLACEGTENTLLQCSHDHLGVHDCALDHSEDISVRCIGMCHWDVSNKTNV